MKRKLIILSFILSLPVIINAQFGLTVSNDTTICIGSEAILSSGLDSALYNTNSYSVFVMPFTPVLPATGTSVSAPSPLTDDQYYGPKPIGFSFCFFGNSYTQFWAGSNGWISFSPLSSGNYDPWVTQSIPNSSASNPRNCVMFPWRDWYPGSNSSYASGSILYNTVGTAPNRKLIVTYLDIALFSCGTPHGNFQCVLHETTNIIDINLLNCPTCPGWNSGNGVMGIQNAPGTIAYTVPGRNNTNWSASNETWRFAPNGVSGITWTDNFGVNYGQSLTLVVSPMVTTTYTATYVDCGVTLTDDVVVTPVPWGTLTGIGSDICWGANNGTASVTISGGTPPFDFYWSNSATLLNSADSVHTISNLPGGMYVVTVASFGGVCELVDSFYVFERPKILVDVGSSPESCPGSEDGIISVGVTNGYNPFVYTCSTQPNSQPTLSANYDFNGLITGNYQITVTDQFGCTGTGSGNVSQLSMQFVTEQSEISCHGDTNAFAAINVSGGTLPYTYQWSNGGNTPGITNLSAGCYQVTVYDGKACEITSEVCFTEPPPVLLYTSGDQTICYSKSANIVSAVIGGTPPYNYLWTPGGYGSGSITVTPPTSTEYCLFVTDANGCKSTQRCVSIFVNPPLNIEAYTLKDTICKGDTSVIFASIGGGNGGPYFYELFQGPIVDPPFEVSPDLTTKYIIIGQDGCGTPTVADTVQITVLPAPTINFTSSVIKGCQPLTVQFSENSPQTGQSYYWDFGDSEYFNNSVEKNPVYIYRNPGIYEVNLTVTTPWNCISIQKLHEDITVWPKPVSVFTAEPQTATIIDPVINFGNTSVNSQQWYWSFGDGDSVMAEYPLPHSYPSIPAEYLVALATESDMGCRDTSYQIITIEEKEDIFYAPNAFNPYSSVEQNQIFRPIASLIDPSTYHLYIYDRWGELIFETTDYEHGWNGRSGNGAVCKIGVYTWLVSYRDLIGVDYKKTGNVLIIQ